MDKQHIVHCPIVEGVLSFALSIMVAIVTQSKRKMIARTSVQSASVRKGSDINTQGNLHEITIDVTPIEL